MNFARVEHNLKEEAIILPSFMEKRKQNNVLFNHVQCFRMYIYGGNDIREGPMKSFWSFELEKMGNLKELSDFSPGPDTYS